MSPTTATARTPFAAAGGDSSQVIGRREVVDGDIEAFGGKRQRDGAADAAARAGDEGLSLWRRVPWRAYAK